MRAKSADAKSNLNSKISWHETDTNDNTKHGIAKNDEESQNE